MARSVSVACILAGAGVARGDGISAVLEPGVSTTQLSHTDDTGHTTEQQTTDFAQRYTLSLDQTLYPNLRLGGTGLFTKDLSWTKDATGATLHGDDTAATGSLRLSLGTGLLGGSLGYDRRQELVPTATGRGWAVGETYSAQAGWHPIDLPTLDLRLSRSDQHDPTSLDGDATTTDGLLAVGYAGVRGLDLRYTLRFDDVSRSDADSRTVNQDARASYRTTALGGRTTAYGTAGISSLWSQTTTSGGRAEVETQRFPVAGLSVIEDFPAVPENDLLSANPALVNGDVRSSAGVNLGFSAGPADRRPRDLGAQLPDVVTKVNRIRVWVDRPLTTAVSGAFVWSAYRSDDGQHWTPVPLTGLVTFATLENRFDIPIEASAARYLKVVTVPLDVAVTTDPRFGDVWVTELQLLDVVPASQVQGATSRLTETLNASAQTRILSSPNLSHDISVSLTHANEGAPSTWLIVNGLSLSEGLAPSLTLSGRVARQDSDAGTGHVGMFQWSGTLAHQPLPTLSEGITYGGQLVQEHGRLDLSNSLAGYGRAQIYRGLAATANAAYAISNSEEGKTSHAATVTVGASIVPNRVLTFGTTYGFSRTLTTGGGSPDVTSTRQRVDVTATVTPVPAVYASAGVSRVFGDARPATLAHASLNLSPFPDGELLARFTYSDSLDTAADSRSQLLSPSLRWTLRPGIFLDLAYTDIRTQAPVEATHIRTASANLTLTL